MDQMRYCMWSPLASWRLHSSAQSWVVVNNTAISGPELDAERQGAGTPLSVASPPAWQWWRGARSLKQPKCGQPDCGGKRSQWETGYSGSKSASSSGWWPWTGQSLLLSISFSISQVGIEFTGWLAAEMRWGSGRSWNAEEPHTNVSVLYSYGVPVRSVPIHLQILPFPFQPNWVRWQPLSLGNQA